ncbi:MAG: hypothetical protein GY711_22165 [bacterium]|nr:hypothetical protein [bacterium]
MRLRLYSLSLLCAAAVSCQSTDQTLDTPAPESNAGSTGSSETDSPELPTNGPVAPIEAAMSVGTSAQDSMQDEAERVARRRERRTSLSQDYVQQGNAELERADLPAALSSFSSALELDPSNETAREGLRQVQSLMGDSYSSAGEAFTDEVERQMVKRAQALLQVEEYVAQGDLALRETRYDDAVISYRQAETILRWHPLIATESLDERILRGRVEEAIQLRDEAVVESRRRAQEQATEERMRAEAAENERREGRLHQYYENANRAFASEDFTQAERWCHQILLLDPGNEAAKSLQRTAREARHHKTDQANRKDYREQWLRTFEELDTSNVPQVDALKFNLDRWRDVTLRKPLSHANINQGTDAERDAVMSRLDSVRFAPNFGQDGDGTPLENVAGFLQQLTGVNFWISNKVRDDLDEEETAINLQLPDRSVRKVLDIIAETSESLRWKVEDGIVKFVTAEELIGGQVLVTYNAQDLIHPIPDYPGRDINISPSGGITPPDEDIEERESNVVNSSLLEDLIRNNIDPESWDADPANSIRITEMGTMVVNQTPEVHEKIQRLLEDLREATGIMVDIQARFMKVEDNFLEDIGIDFRGLGQPGLGSDGTDFNDFGDPTLVGDLADSPGRDTTLGAFYDEHGDGDVRARVEDLYDTQLGNDEFRASGGLSFQWTYLNDLELELIMRAVSKSERVELVTAPRILVHNTARANLSVLNQVAYVQDFDVEIAQAASIADPIVAVIQDGVILDVRPVVSADRRFITLELRPTIAVLQRPIAERVTTLGSQNSVTIQLPEVEIQRVRTSIPIPDGGTVMLGGMKESERQDQRSGVPILNKVPILSAFFERKGNFISNRKLLILLRANIVIPEEVEPEASELGLTED